MRGFSLYQGHKIKTLVLSQEEHFHYSLGMKLGLVSTGLWLEALNFFKIFYITEHLVMNFTNILLHQHDLYETREDKINFQDVILDELRCIFSEKCPCLFCSIPSLLGRYVKALRRTQIMCAMTCAHRIKMWFSYKIAV